MRNDVPNATLIKFGYPHALIYEGRYWAVLVRPQQPTLGSLVLCTRGEETAYADMPPAAFIEQGDLVAQIERLLGSFVRFERINYLMLMMVDPHVHFHVLPRYVGERTYGEAIFLDRGWPGLPDLAASQPAGEELVTELRTRWRESLQ